MKFKSILSVGLAFGLVGGLVLGMAGEADAKKVRWKMQSTFGSKLPHLGTTAVRFSKNVKDMTDGQLNTKFFEPGALVPSLECFDAVSKGALELAQRNAAALELEVHWSRADALDQDRAGWPAPLTGIVSNPPYIPHSESGLMEEHVTRHEPGIALFVPDDDPLVFYRSLCGAALELLPSGGCLAAECHHALTRDVAECWQLEVGETAVLSDLQGAERAVRLNRP